MRLEAMREAAAQLMTRMRLGRDVFARGMPEGTKTIRETEFTAKIYDLLHAYADQRRRTIKVRHVVKVRTVWSIKDARDAPRSACSASAPSAWTNWSGPSSTACRIGRATTTPAPCWRARSAPRSRWRATACIELRQDEPFAPIYMRKRESGRAIRCQRR